MIRIKLLSFVNQLLYILITYSRNLLMENGLLI